MPLSSIQQQRDVCMQQLIKTSPIALKRVIEDRASAAARTGNCSSIQRGFKNLGRHCCKTGRLFKHTEGFQEAGQAQCCNAGLSARPICLQGHAFRLACATVLDDDAFERSLCPAHSAHRHEQAKGHSSMLMCLLISSATPCKVCERVANLFQKALVRLGSPEQDSNLQASRVCDAAGAPLRKCVVPGCWKQKRIGAIGHIRIQAQPAAARVSHGPGG